MISDLTGKRFYDVMFTYLIKHINLIILKDTVARWKSVRLDNEGSLLRVPEESTLSST